MPARFWGYYRTIVPPQKLLFIVSLDPIKFAFIKLKVDFHCWIIFMFGRTLINARKINNKIK